MAVGRSTFLGLISGPAMTSFRVWFHLLINLACGPGPSRPAKPKLLVEPKSKMQPAASVSQSSTPGSPDSGCVANEPLTRTQAGPPLAVVVVDSGGASVMTTVTALQISETQTFNVCSPVSVPGGTRRTLVTALKQQTHHHSTQMQRKKSEYVHITRLDLSN